MLGKDLIMQTLLGGGSGGSGGGGGEEDEKSPLDSLIDRSIAEISNNSKALGDNAFAGCRALKTANFPQAVTVGNYAFSYCVSLDTLKLPLAQTIGAYAFEHTKLTTADFPMVKTTGSYMFSACFELTAAKLHEANTLASNSFNSCNGLKTADFVRLTRIEDRAFSGCGTMTSLILRSETLCALSSTYVFNNCYHMLGTYNKTYNPDSLHDGYVYVPRSLINEYPDATNWSSLSLQYRVLEDYTVDGTITGELDESKI